VASECNEHRNGDWRRILFDIKQFIDLVNKVSICTGAFFRAGLLVSRGESSSGDSQSNMGDFVQSLQDATTGGDASISCGPLHINLEYSVVDQLWSDVEGMIKLVNAVMTPFLSLFGRVEGNGLSPFMRDFSSAICLRDEIMTFSILQKVIKEIRIWA
jgi:hypothetical protein